MNSWELSYRGWEPLDQPLRESLTTLGNGYFATRGAAEEVSADGVHYPGTYLAGGYNRAESEIVDKMIESEDLVNWPNWLPLTFRCEDGDWFNLEKVEICDYEQNLDLRSGSLKRKIHFRERPGRDFILASQRFVSMADSHVSGIEWKLTSLNWSGAVIIKSAIDGNVCNGGVERYRDLNGNHFDVLETDAAGEDVIYLLSRTKQSRIVMAQAARTQLISESGTSVLDRHLEKKTKEVAHYIKAQCEQKKAITIEKIVTTYTSRDFAISEPRLEACKELELLPRFCTLLKRQQLAWDRLWRRADLKLQGQDEYAQLVLRLHIFHLLQTASMNTIDLDVGIPARGLHGEAYRGHIFWDDIFAITFLNLRIPELTRSFLMYRYRRLGKARQAAIAHGYEGAMFPWQSGSNGREETQGLHLNPKSGRWLPDYTDLQRHVNSAIAYNIWQYYQATEDTEFMTFYGIEMLLEIARFWASKVEYNANTERYEIKCIAGPDEYHTQYPGSDQPGINNNAYTNIMVSWTLVTALKSLSIVADDRRSELLSALDISDEDLTRWEKISRRLFVPFLEGGIISQFEGWESLKELDWEGLRKKHGNIQRLDRVLEAEKDDTNRYKASKQADVLMLFFLFSAEELSEVLSRLAYVMDQDFIPRNVRYYIQRTSHGSTLSRMVHAWVLARSDRKQSWDLFREALASDIEDIQGGSTPEGIHMGAMAGTVDLMQRCYTGIEMREEVLWLNPQLPDDLECLKFFIRYRTHWLALRITQDHLEVSFEKSWTTKALIGFRGEVREMSPGERICFDLGKNKITEQELAS